MSALHGEGRQHMPYPPHADADALALARQPPDPFENRRFEDNGDGYNKVFHSDGMDSDGGVLDAASDGSGSGSEGSGSGSEGSGSGSEGSGSGSEPPDLFENHRFEDNGDGYNEIFRSNGVDSDASGGGSEDGGRPGEMRMDGGSLDAASDDGGGPGDMDVDIEAPAEAAAAEAVARKGPPDLAWAFVLRTCCSPGGAACSGWLKVLGVLFRRHSAHMPPVAGQQAPLPARGQQAAPPARGQQAALRAAGPPAGSDGMHELLTAMQELGPDEDAQLYVARVLWELTADPVECGRMKVQRYAHDDPARRLHSWAALPAHTGCADRCDKLVAHGGVAAIVAAMQAHANNLGLLTACYGVLRVVGPKILTATPTTAQCEALRDVMLRDLSQTHRNTAAHELKASVLQLAALMEPALHVPLGQYLSIVNNAFVKAGVREMHTELRTGTPFARCRISREGCKMISALLISRANAYYRNCKLEALGPTDIKTHDLVRVLTEVLTASHRDAPIQLRVCQLLTMILSYTHSRAEQAALMEETPYLPGLLLRVAASGDSDVRTVDEALGLLRSLTTHSDAVCQTLSQSLALQTLVSFLPPVYLRQDASEMAYRGAVCGVLQNICRFATRETLAVLRQSAVPLLAVFMRTSIHAQDLVYSAGSFLQALLQRSIPFVPSSPTSAFAVSDARDSARGCEWPGFQGALHAVLDVLDSPLGHIGPIQGMFTTILLTLTKYHVSRKEVCAAEGVAAMARVFCRNPKSPIVARNTLELFGIMGIDLDGRTFAPFSCNVFGMQGHTDDTMHVRQIEPQLFTKALEIAVVEHAHDRRTIVAIISVMRLFWNCMHIDKKFLTWGTMRRATSVLSTVLSNPIITAEDACRVFEIFVMLIPCPKWRDHECAAQVMPAMSICLSSREEFQGHAELVCLAAEWVLGMVEHSRGEKLMDGATRLYLQQALARFDKTPCEKEILCETVRSALQTPVAGA